MAAFLGGAVALYLAVVFLVVFYLVGELLLFPEKAYHRMELLERYQLRHGQHACNTANETESGKGLGSNPIQPVITQIETLEVGE